MRIGIDARPLGRRRSTGIENYIRGLVELLPRLAPQHDYFLYSNRPIELSCSARSLTERIDSAFRWCPGSFWLLGRAAQLAWKDKLDVFWSTVEIIPPLMPKGVWRVVTVHDLVWLRFPETTTRYNLLVQSLCARKAIAGADCLVVNSGSTAAELGQFLGVPRQKTTVVYPGIADRYRPQEREKAAEYISRKYGVPRRYMATAGIVHPRKNQQFLAKVIGILKRNGQLDCPLLIAGLIGWKNSSLFREIEAAGLTDKEIRFLGYVPDEDMPCFYAGAQVFLFPSLYEGFGIPPVEAMACGAPVIASDCPALPEVLADAAILLSPTDPERFAAATREVLSNGQLQRDLSDKGIRRAQRFQYDSSVRQLLEVFDRPRAVMRAEDSRKEAVASSI
jgi:glycosyltransferase involved in cell wall biosynthesis